MPVRFWADKKKEKPGLKVKMMSIILFIFLQSQCKTNELLLFDIWLAGNSLLISLRKNRIE